MLHNIFSLFVYKQSHYGELVQEFLFSVLSHTHTHTFSECIQFLY